VDERMIKFVMKLSVARDNLKGFDPADYDKQIHRER
jgi:hypothetical protein